MGVDEEKNLAKLSKAQLIDQVKSIQDRVIGLVSKLNSYEIDLISIKSLDDRSQDIDLEEALRLIATKNRNERIINSITRSVHETIDLEKVLENAVDALKQNLDPTEHVAIYLIEGDKAEMRAYRGHPEWFVEKIKRIPRPNGFTWKTIMDGKPLYCSDVENDDLNDPEGRDVGSRSYVSMPLFDNENAVGCINVHSSEKNAFDENELKLLEIVAQQISVAINNANKAEALLNSEERVRLYAEKLEKSNEELQQFAYIASHDLQEPLRMVGSYLGLLERRYKDRLDSDADEFINYAVDGAKRMQVLVNDLLSYSRVSTRAKPFESANCENLIKPVLKNLEIAIQESGAEVMYEDLPEEIVVDMTQMSQLFQNLIGNAMKFCDKEEPRIVVRAEEGEDEWEFSVKDNGIGIDPEYSERIFEIFQRLHGKGEYPGTGIGLAICKKIVERHGGRIWVESEKGEGAVFLFTIPKSKENISDDDETQLEQRKIA